MVDAVVCELNAGSGGRPSTHDVGVILGKGDVKSGVCINVCLFWMDAFFRDSLPCVIVSVGWL